MEENNKKPPTGNARREGEGGFPREDSNRIGTGADSPAYKQFARDKRKRIIRVEKNPRPAQGEMPQSQPRERKSFNPNFDEDNKLRTSPVARKTDELRESDFMHPSGKAVGFNADRPVGAERPARPAPSKGYGQRDRMPYDRDGGERPTRPAYGNKERYPAEGRSDSRPPYPRRDAEGGYGRPQFPPKGRDYDNNRRSPQGERDARPSYGDRDRRRDSYPGGDRGDGRQRQRPRGGQPFGKRPGGPGSKKGYFADHSYPTFPREAVAGEMRLNRFISISGVCSRREADELIAAGKVTVNGEVVTELGTKVKPGDSVKYDGKNMQGESKVYIVMNKPKGFVTSLEDPHAEKVVMDLLKNTVKERVYPVGRLDKSSMGVLLITNDGELTKKLTHPSYNKKKIYQVSLDKALTKADMQALADGITLEDGEIRVDEINYVGESRKEIGVEIHSGRNRIVRRMFSHLGYTVQKLDRVYFAGLTKKNLKRGSWRFLTPREVDTLHNGKYE